LNLSSSMNGFGGVRRFLASATGGTGGTASPPTSEAPLKPGAPTWPPPLPSSGSNPPSPITSPLLLRKEKLEEAETPRSPVRSRSQSKRPPLSGSPKPSSPSSLSRMSSPNTRPVRSRTASQPPANRRDELLISLLASEAVVDSRDFEILSSEEVEELKKEQLSLMTRQGSLTKKVTLETKIRDAALSLSKVNASHKTVSKQSEEQLEASNKRVAAVQLELQRITERTNEVNRRLLEHRAGVLSYSVRSMERKNDSTHNDSGYTTPHHSPSGSTVTRFDGAHFFAGHESSVIPNSNISKIVPAAAVMELEEKLTRATEALAASSAKQAELVRDLAAARAEKEAAEEVARAEADRATEANRAREAALAETDIAGAEELLRAQETIAALEAARPDVDALIKAERARADQERAELVRGFDEERESLTQERNAVEEERLEDLARLQEESDRIRAEDTAALKLLQTELDDSTAALQALIATHSIPLYARNPSITALVTTIGTHVQGLAANADSHASAQAEWDTVRRKLEEDVRAGWDKREALSRDIEEARREREEARNELRAMELRVKTDVPSLSPPAQVETADNKEIIALLQPIWAILPSPEARAAKFSQQRAFRAGSGPTSPTNSSPNSPNPPGSLSELDVRALKSLYDPRAPPSPNPSVGGTFTFVAFAARVQALIADDRSLIERLIRFAQAHDLLKKNAERAQKLAQEGNLALETYQKQVRTLEERNMDLTTKVSALQSEVTELENNVERVLSEKRDVEASAADQAATCIQLTEANNALSAKTLALAEEAAAAPEAVRRQLEGQLTEVRAALEAARTEVDAVRNAGSGQQMALMEELNNLQMENDKLRDQVRSIKK
ncbi:unnamed protein product, partial [Mycena citricolor]